MRVESWGRLAAESATFAQPAFSCELRACVQASGRPLPGKALVVGNLRSYGDQVLNDDGHYVQTTRCDRILALDREAPSITVECGVRIADLHRHILPLGLMLPVTPGTALLTVGGAIANDVHGKNHHVAGTFGCFVERFELARSSGETRVCSRTEHPDWFAATIGGMGLTGAIPWATLRLRRIASPLLDVHSRRFANLGEFFALDAELSAAREYAVAWIDCLAKGAALGRGIFSSAEHCAGEPAPTAVESREARRPTLRIPFAPPLSPVNRLSLGLFNALYFRAHPDRRHTARFERWLYPLDAVHSWNRLYGKRGFFQFQCVVPRAPARDAITEMLTAIGASGQGSFLAVLKNFGDKPSPGLMSFPMPGTTLALDFPNLGARTRELLLRLHDIAAAAGGRLYPAKDGCSPPDSLMRGYPNLARFQRFLDPGLGSRLAQRLRVFT